MLSSLRSSDLVGAQCSRTIQLQLNITSNAKDHSLHHFHSIVTTFQVNRHRSPLAVPRTLKAWFKASSTFAKKLATLDPEESVRLPLIYLPRTDTSIRLLTKCANI